MPTLNKLFVQQNTILYAFSFMSRIIFNQNFNITIEMEKNKNDV